MTVEVTPVDVACERKCVMCYQEGLRYSGNAGKGKPDVEAMKRALIREGGDSFTVFGGEPLLTPLSVLEDLFAFGLERNGGCGIQTDGYLMTDKHIRLFFRYNVQPSFSIDGPGRLNHMRWMGSVKETRDATAKSIRALEKCFEAGLNPGLISTMHRGNCSNPRLPRLIEWLEHLESLGLSSMRLHLLELDTDRAVKWDLTAGQKMWAWDTLLDHGFEKLRFSEWEDIKKKLVEGPVSVTCTKNGCDPLSTPAVQAINSQGVQANCHRTDKEGVTWMKSEDWGRERYLSLYQTPQRDGGCKGCRFFYACMGECPGTAIDGDWRNRTRDCVTWLHLFERAERELLEAGKIPLTTMPHTRLVSEMVALGKIKTPGDDGQGHGDAHGDSHGDHTDDNS